MLADPSSSVEKSFTVHPKNRIINELTPRSGSQDQGWRNCREISGRKSTGSRSCAMAETLPPAREHDLFKERFSARTKKPVPDGTGWFVRNGTGRYLPSR